MKTMGYASLPQYPPSYRVMRSYVHCVMGAYESSYLVKTVRRDGDYPDGIILGMKSRFLRSRISRSVRHWFPFERVTQHTRRLRLYELQRKEPLYNPRWPPPQRGLLLANTKQEAPPWLTARDGMIYWDFCLFAPALQRTRRA